MTATLSADGRMRRLLALIPWVAQRGRVPVEEVCSRFGFTEQELAEDLELLFMCGVHPYQPDDLIEAMIDDGEVSIAYADWFRRPLRLTPAQGLVLVMSAGALLSIPGTDSDGPLATALDKVAAVVGAEPGESPDVELGEADPAALTTLRTGVAESRQVDLDYYSFGGDRTTRRTVEPWSVFSQSGAWYLRGYCHQAADTRLFRIDRIRSLALLDSTFEPPDDPGPPNVYERRSDDPVVVIEVDAHARWVAASYPHDGVEELAGDRLRIRLPVGERAWLERLLLVLGEHGHVVDAPPDLFGAGPDAATRLLSRYR